MKLLEMERPQSFAFAEAKRIIEWLASRALALPPSLIDVTVVPASSWREAAALLAAIQLAPPAAAIPRRPASSSWTPTA